MQCTVGSVSRDNRVSSVMARMAQARLYEPEDDILTSDSHDSLAIGEVYSRQKDL